MTDLQGAIEVDGCRDQPSKQSGANRGAAPLPVDIEFVVSWAVARSGRLPWDNARDTELMFDQGLTAKLRRRPPSDWQLSQALAGVRRERRPLRPMMVPSGDAERVIAAIKRLPAAAASTVLICGRGKIRPDCMLGIVPVRVPRLVRCKKRHQLVTRMFWEPRDPASIRAARDIYAAWHAAMRRLVDELQGTLDAWQINGFAAPARPWEGEAARCA